MKRSTLAEANERRDWRIWADIAEHLLGRARKLQGGEDLGLDIDSTLYALDSTTIDLCLSLFDWAPFKSTKAAVKLHTLLDLRGSIPSFIHISDGKMHDVRVIYRQDWYRGQPQSTTSRGLVDHPRSVSRQFSMLHHQEALPTIRPSAILPFIPNPHPADQGTGVIFW